MLEWCPAYSQQRSFPGGWVQARGCVLKEWGGLLYIFCPSVLFKIFFTNIVLLHWKHLLKSPAETPILQILALSSGPHSAVPSFRQTSQAARSKSHFHLCWPLLLHSLCFKCNWLFTALYTHLLPNHQGLFYSLWPWFLLPVWHIVGFNKHTVGIQ